MESQATVPAAYPAGRKFYYRRHGRWFEIMKANPTVNGVSSASPLYPNERYLSQQEARRRVYELNGWPQPRESKPIQ